jgi:hypothetical protein
MFAMARVPFTQTLPWKVFDEASKIASLYKKNIFPLHSETFMYLWLCLWLCAWPRVTAGFPVFDIGPHVQTWDLSRVDTCTLERSDGLTLVLRRDSPCLWCSGYRHLPEWTADSVSVSPVLEWLCVDHTHTVRVTLSALSGHRTWLWHAANESLCAEGLHPYTRKDLAALDYTPPRDDRLVAAVLEYAVLPLISLYLVGLCWCKRRWQPGPDLSLLTYEADADADADEHSLSRTANEWLSSAPLPSSGLL